MKTKSPASGKRQGLLSKTLGSTDNSKKLKKTKDINRLQVLNDIAIKWVENGYYVDSGKALQALIGGEL